MALQIREMVFDDIHEIMKWVNTPEVLATFANFKPVSFEEEAVFLLQLLKSTTDFTYTLEYEGKYAGQVSINKVYWAARNGRVAAYLKPDFRGKGLGKQALTLLLQKGFEELDLHKLWLMVRETNLKARQLYEAVGFEKEAILIDEYIDPSSQQYVNMIRMYLINPLHQ